MEIKSGIEIATTPVGGLAMTEKLNANGREHMKNRILVSRHIRQAQCKLRTSQREAFSRLSGISNWDGFSLLRLQASWRELFRYRHHFIVLIFALLNQNFLVGFLGTPIPQGMPEVSVSQGKAGFSIPIDLPPGKMVPGLALSYNSGGGNGLVGVGWELSGMEFIQRDPSFGINFNNGDTFSSSMGGRLVPVGGGNYQTFKESFVRYTPSGGCGASYCSWIATDKSGTKYHFGGTADSQIVAVGRAEIRVWALSKVVDLHGNQYSISYNSDGNGGYWPVSLNYANRTIVFGYAGRGDHSQDYSQGANSQLVYRLTSVSIQVNGSEIRR
ncbi:MAG: hypothetical protein K8R21_13570, partial [Leptospira sp.]|nr:hypothetical protein [Leptospira sp.]